MKWILPSLSAWVLVVGLTSGCNPRVEGCLDIEAENFDFEAERNSPELCQYPDLVLSVTYRWGDTTFIPGGFYTNDLGQEFAVTSFFVLMSDFSVFSVDQDELRVLETVDWCLESAGRVEVIDDFVVVDRSKFAFPIGTIDRSGVQASWQYMIGVDGALLPACIDSLPSGHPLRTKDGVFLEDSGAVASARFVVSRDTSGMSLDTFTVITVPIQGAAPLDKVFVAGRNDTISIIADLQPLFQSINLDAPGDEVESQLANHLESMIRDNN